MSSKIGDGESTPLLGGGNNNNNNNNNNNKDHHRRTTSSSSYYFLQQNAGGVESSADDASNITNRSGVTAVHENIPAGSQPDDFGPKILAQNTKHPSMMKETSQQQDQANQQNVDSQWGGGKGKLDFFNVFLGLSGGEGDNNNKSNGNNNNNNQINDNNNNTAGGSGSANNNNNHPHHHHQAVMDDGINNATQQKKKHQRKAPIKIEPKVFFSNERTFLAWMHISVLLAGASIFILAVAPPSSSSSSPPPPVDDGGSGYGSTTGSNSTRRLPEKQLYGIITLPVAIAFIVYSMYQYVNRAYMIRNKLPGPYSNSIGPAILTIILMLSIVCQFGIKLYSIRSNRQASSSR